MDGNGETDGRMLAGGGGGVGGGRGEGWRGRGAPAGTFVTNPGSSAWSRRRGRRSSTSPARSAS